MKKKFIAVYALIGVLALGSTTLTSCVDDNESPSVTAIRDAKAQQLAAIANYNDAMAEAERITAQAEAALNNAKAAGERAQALKDSLGAEVVKATIEIDIQTAVAQAEAQLAAQQAILLQAQAELSKVSDAASVATKEKIENLNAAINAVLYGGKYKSYGIEVTTDGYGNVTVSADGDAVIDVAKGESLLGDGPDAANAADKGLRYQLIEKKADKTEAELDLASTQRKIAEFVRKEQENLATNQALLAEYQKYNNTDRDAAKKAADEAQAKLAGLKEVLDQATALYNEESLKINEANTALKGTEVEKFFATGTNETDYAAVITREAPEGEEITVTYDDGTSATTTPDYKSYTLYEKQTTTLPGGGTSISYKETTQTIKEQITVDADALADLVTAAARALEVEEAKLKTAEKTHADGLKDAADITSYSWGYDTYGDLKDAIEEATKKFADEPTDDNKTLLETLEGYEDEYLSDLDQDLDTAETNVTDAEEAKAEVDALNTMLTGDAFKTYTAAYEAVVKAVDASMEKKVEKMKADHNYDVQKTLAGTLGNIAAGYTDWTAVINTKQSAIETNEKNIALMTDDGKPSSDMSSTGKTEAQRQAYIDALDVEIAQIEKEISIREAQYEDFMQQIEELIKADDATTTPDTPAEGEETPAA